MVLSIIIFIIIIWTIFTEWIDYINVKHKPEKLTEDMKDYYDDTQWNKALAYSKKKYKLSLVQSIIGFIEIMVILSFGWFGYLDTIIRGFTSNEMVVTLVFFWIITIGSTILSLPLSWYSTFVIEEEFGFNKTTKATFIKDFLKWIALSAVLWAIVMVPILWLYGKLGSSFWLYAWIFISIFGLVLQYFYSEFIVPIFNKQEKLEDGELKTAIIEFANKVDFPVDEIYVIDWSTRSTKSNAYFAWFWKKKRIVLFDTLIKNFSKEEIVAVLAHEIGHYKNKHIIKWMIISTLESGFVLFIASLFLWNPLFSTALGASVPSFHICLIAFSLLYSPLNIVSWIFGNYLSRKHEYEADAFAKLHYSAKYLMSSLKKLTIENLSDIKPHPIYEFVTYSHPSVLKRIWALQE